MDIDCFKQYKDNYPSAAGDYCVQQIANTLCDLLPEDEGVVARYQGEDFICVLSDTDEKRALDMAKRITVALKNLAIAHENSNVAHYVTMSIGISMSSPERPLTPEAILHQADTALNEAKAAGKNAYKLVR